MKRFDPSSTKLHNKKISHRKAGGGSESKSSTKRVTEKNLAITGQYVGYLFCTNYLRRFCMPGLLPLCTKYSLPTRLVSGPTIDVRITRRCTGFWSSAVESGVYRCTSAPLTSRKRSTVSSIRRFGILCGSMESSQHT